MVCVKIKGYIPQIVGLLILKQIIFGQWTQVRKLAPGERRVVQVKRCGKSAPVRKVTYGAM